MKSKLIIYIVFLTYCLLCSSSYAATQTTSSITVSVTVQGSFSLMVNSDSFDFARMAPGQTAEMTRSEGIAVTGASTSGNPWYLKVTAEKPLASGISYIPNENFSWYGTSEGSGTWYGAKERNFADPQEIAYISSADEADTSGKAINNFKFKLHAPEDTKPGYYTTTVMFTMTE